MMGSCSLWLLLVALLSSVRTYSQQRTEDHGLTFLVAIKSNESGLEINTHLRLENQGNEDIERYRSHPKSQVHFIPGHNLSSACGDQYFRCQELLVKTLLFQGTNSNRKINVIFVPLETGILLLFNWYDSYNVEMKLSIFDFNCHPVVFYEIYSKVYMVCINNYSHGNYTMRVYEVILTLTSSGIENVTPLGPRVTCEIIKDMPSWLNFHILNVEDKIYVAVGNNIIVVDTLNSTQTQCMSSGLPNCSQIYNLVPTINIDGQPLLVADCSDRFIHFDPIRGDWNDIIIIPSGSKRYICPDRNYNVTLITNSTASEGDSRDLVWFSERDSSPITLAKTISGGLCFESQNKTYFAFSDLQSNRILVYDFSTQNHYPVSPYDCLVQPDCPQLLLLQNQYLVIRDANCDLVLDSTTTNFSLTFNISSGTADILAVLHGNIYSTITPSPPLIHSTTTAKVPPAPGNYETSLITTLSISFQCTSEV